MAINRNISYLNKDFTDFRSELINFSQTYFPNTYTDFSNTSPGIMFMEQASYVGDVLSFYLDTQVQETFLQYAKQSNNLYELAYMFGYKPKVTGLASVLLEFFQVVPAITSGGERVPDFSYSILVDSNSTISSQDDQSFIIEDPVDFSVSSSLDPTEVTISQITGNEPEFFLLKKTRKASSGVISTTTFTIGNYSPFPTIEIDASDVAEIIDVFDSDGNQYYEVDYLGQELIYDNIKNTNVNDPNNYLSSNDTPYILKTKQTQRRFATRFLNETTLQLQFGSGTPGDTDEEIIPNPDNVGLGLPFEKNKLTTAFSPTNFIFTNTYGIAPSNTTLTIRYLVGGGVSSNIAANSLTSLDSVNSRFINSNLTPVTAQFVFDSLAVNNPTAASGGQDGDTIEEIRQNTISNFNSQLRNVTADDYLVRALSMPAKFGVVSKAYTQKPKAESADTTLCIYVLTYDVDRKLIASSNSLKQNLKTYLNQYRMIGDSIDIKDAYVINIGCEFEIITLPNYNNNEILANCITEVQKYFNINKWQINQPIIIKDIEIILDNVNGVQTVNKVQIINKTGTTLGYSRYAYDVSSATLKNIIYPSLDPSIFEVKYLNEDIKGRVVTI